MKSYVIAVEFPVEAFCTIPEYKESVYIKSGICKRKTILEHLEINKFVTFEQDFAEIDPRLQGLIRVSFLIDSQGNLTTANSDASWVKAAGHEPYVYRGNVLKYDLTDEEILDNYDLSEDSYYDNEFYQGGQTCQDGILICGPRPGSNTKIGVLWESNVLSLGRDNFVLDVRGYLKPPISPARRPIKTDGTVWMRLNYLCHLAHGRLWEKVLAKFNNDNIGLFWELAIIHKVMVPWIPSMTLWNLISVPIERNNKIEWRKISSLGSLLVQEDEYPKIYDPYMVYIKPHSLKTLDGDYLSVTESIKKWQVNPMNYLDRSKDMESGYYNEYIETLLSGRINIWATIIGMSTVSLINNKPALLLNEPISNDAPFVYWLNLYKEKYFALLPYEQFLSDVLIIHMPFKNANRNHPISKVVYDSLYNEEKSDLEVFASELVRNLCDYNNIDGMSKSDKTFDGCRYIGKLYQLVEWTNYAIELHPPYKIWKKNSGFIEITKNDFESWANNSSN